MSPRYSLVLTALLLINTNNISIRNAAAEDSSKQVAYFSDKKLVDSYEKLASRIASAAEQAGIHGGICLDLGCGDATLAVKLAQLTDLSFYCLDPRKKVIEQARTVISASGLYGPRVCAWESSMAHLPLPNHCADLIIKGDMFLLDGELSFKEIVRVLRPGGVAYIGQSLEGSKHAKKPISAEWLKRQLAAAGIEGFEIVENDGVWAKFVSPAVSGAGEWSHVYCDPSNSRYSKDTHIKPPLSLLWYSDVLPYGGSDRTVAAGGRLFTVGNNCEELYEYSGQSIFGRDVLCAFNGYSGKLLWMKDLGGMPAAMRSGGWAEMYARDDFFAASDDRIYVANGNDCVCYEASTGKELQRYPSPLGTNSLWIYVAHMDGLLCGACIGPQSGDKGSPEEVEKALFVTDATTGKIRWIHSRRDFIAAVPAAIGEGSVFALSKAALVAFDLASGKEQWTIDAPDFLSHVMEKRLLGRAMCHEGMLYIPTYDNLRDELPYRLPTFSMAAIRIKDGTILQNIFSSTGERETMKLIFVGDAIIPSTGCNHPSGAGSCIFDKGRQFIREKAGNTALVVYDVKARKQYAYWGFRPPCSTAGVIANGTYYCPPHHGCRCGIFLGMTALTSKQEAQVQQQASKNPILEFASNLSEKMEKQAAPSDWPTTGHDPQRLYTCPDTPQFPLAPAWHVKANGSFTAPIVVGEHVYVGSSDHKVHALDASTSKVQWSFATDAPIRCAPTYWSGRIYVGSDDGWVYCLGASDGQLLWKFRAACDAERICENGCLISRWPVRSGVVIDKGTAYFCAGHHPMEGVHIYAVDAKKGELVWRKEAEQQWRLMPEGVMAVSKENLIIPSGGSRTVIALDLKTGEKKWALPGTYVVGYKNTLNPMGVSCFTFGQDEVVLIPGSRACMASDGKEYRAFQDYFGSKQKDLRQLVNAVIDKDVYHQAGYTLQCIGSNDDKNDKVQIKWKKPLEEICLWLIKAGDIAFAAGNGRVIAVQCNNGDLLWEGSFEGGAKGLAACAGRLYITTDEGLYCFAHDPLRKQEPVRTELLRTILVNCGARHTQQDAGGGIWEGDWLKVYEGKSWGLLLSDDGMIGESIVSPELYAIANTKEPWLYRSRREGMVGYIFRLSPGDYAVRLHFSEMDPSVKGKGERIFDVLVQNKIALQDFDIFAEAGAHGKPVVKTVECRNIIDTLEIKFIKKDKGKGLPQINAIEIAPL